MRKIYSLLLFFVMYESFSQNTFPTSGNVGIGTNTPAYLLDVNSASQRLYNPTGATILRIEGNGTANYAGSYIYLSAGTPRIGDTFTKVRIDANRGLDSTSLFQYSRMNGDTYSGIFYQYGDLVGHRFFTPASRSAASTSEVFRISPDGRVGIGSTTLTNRTLALGTPISGGTTSYGMLNNGLVKSDVTAGAYLNYSQLNTQATSFTLPAAVHFLASEGTIGAGSSVTSQIGFWVSSNMISAANNFGYRSAIPIGTNNWNLYLEGTANNFMAGALGVGTTSLVGNNFRISKTITGAATSIGVRSDGQIQPDVTGAAYYYRSDASTAASTTTGNITHYFANQSALGSGSTVDTQTGFSVGSSLIGATNNYGFYGNIGAGTGRWNLYMGGTASNYLAGRLGIGTTTLNSSNVAISSPLTGNAGFFYSLYNYGFVQSDVTGIAAYNRTYAGVQAGAVALDNLIHYGAYQNTFGGRTVTNQYGIYVDPSLTGATNNYGIYGNIGAGTGRWNLYMGGTANNYLAGRLGIGTTTPASGLEVAASGGVLISNVSQDGKLTFQRTGGNTFSFQHDADRFYLYNNTTALPLLTVLNGGNVGIGTTTSNYPLQISTSGPYVAGFTRASVGTGAIAISQLSASSTADIVLEGQQASSGVVLRSRDASNNAINSLAVDRNGNVGIGTLSPQSNLHLTADGPILSTTATNGASGLRVNVLGQTAGTAFRVQNAGNTIFQVDLNGSIGIGTGSTALPTGYKLAIAGNVIAEKVKVKKQVGGAWPDYVFSPEYKLPSLEEIEKFTKENNHLPEIPSAKEVEKEGQDLGEMNRLLLKKIEELTLYVIELKKENDKQNQKIEKQNLEIEKLKK